MMKILIIVLSIIFSMPAYASENVFYILRHVTPEQIANLNNHRHFIDIIISQAYKVDENGMVSGYVDPHLLDFTKDNKIKLMAMVTNVNFDKVKVHRFLNNRRAMQRALDAIISEAKKNHYYGVQFDFEMVGINDRDALTQFLQTAAMELHKKGFAVSVAVAPVTSSYPQSTDYLKALYTVWEGAYDLKALSKSSDFLTVMTYDQHTAGTTPGPIASVPWMTRVIKYMLNYVPANKLSLGIPTYSSFWYTGQTRAYGEWRFSMHMDELKYNQVQPLLQKRNASLNWNATDKVNYASYEHNGLREYIFVENAKSFQAKLKLANQYHLRGISVFRIGIEDPKIWGGVAPPLKKGD